MATFITTILVLCWIIPLWKVLSFWVVCTFLPFMLADKGSEDGSDVH